MMTTGAGRAAHFAMWESELPDEQRRRLRTAGAALDAGDLHAAREALVPLLSSELPHALFLSACFALPGESHEEFSTRRLAQLQHAAARNYPPALYAVGRHFDVGDDAIVDKARANELFACAAALGHAHSQYIFGTALLYGAQDMPVERELGLALLREAAGARSRGAIECLARFYETGEHGVPIDLKEAARLRAQLQSDDLLDD